MTLTPERRAEMRSLLGGVLYVSLSDYELRTLLDAADERDRLHECLDQRERCQLLVEKERDWLAADNANLRSLLVECAGFFAQKHIARELRKRCEAALAPAPEPIALPPGDSLPRLDEAETKEKP